ncbi:MAG: hypothetical protein AB2A00_27830 [Myxococcota bacterium]
MSPREDSSESLDARVVELASQVKLVGGRMVLPQAAYDAWRERLAQVPSSEQEEVLVGLLALGSRFVREAPEASRDALGQLMSLAAVLLTPEDAEQLFSSMGLVSPNQHADVTGAARVSNRPVTTAGGAGSSVMGVRLGNKKRK